MEGLLQYQLKSAKARAMSRSGSCYSGNRDDDNGAGDSGSVDDREPFRKRLKKPSTLSKKKKKKSKGAARFIDGEAECSGTAEGEDNGGGDDHDDDSFINNSLQEDDDDEMMHISVTREKEQYREGAAQDTDMRVICDNDDDVDGGGGGGGGGGGAVLDAQYNEGSGRAQLSNVQRIGLEGTSFFAAQNRENQRVLDDDPNKRLDTDPKHRFSGINVSKLFNELGWPKVNFSTSSIAELDWVIDFLFNMWLIQEPRGSMTDVRKMYENSLVGQEQNVERKANARDEWRSRVQTVAARTYVGDRTVSAYDANARLRSIDSDDDDLPGDNAFLRAAEQGGIDMSNAVDFSRYTDTPLEHLTSAQQQAIIARHYPQFSMRYDDDQFKAARIEDVAFVNFGIDRSNPQEMKSISIDYVERLMKTMFLFVHMLERQVYLLSQQPDMNDAIHGEKMFEIYTQKLRTLYWQMHYCRMVVLTVTSACEGNRVGATRTDVPILVQALGIRSTADGGDVRDGMNHHQKLFFRFLMETFEKGWKRVGENIYEEVQSKGCRTNAFRMRCTIEEYAHQLPHPVIDPEGFNAYTGQAKTIGWAVQTLTKMHYDNIFPDLKRCQTQWSFSQGVYCGEEDRFWRYDDKRTYEDPESPFVTGAASARYIEMEFPEEIMTEPYMKHPERIEVESFRKIFDSQQFSEDQIYWTWAFIGRLYYPVRSKDNWQVMLWLKGQSGTGKSTIARGVTNAYEFCDVGILGNTVEETFGLETLYDKFLVVAPEIKKNFKLDLATFQAMVAGDAVSVARKNKKAKGLAAWTAQMLMCSNDFPNWVDSAGAIMRRVMCLLFKYSIPPDQRDTRLDERVLKDLARIIVKANRHYLHTVKRYKNGEDVWSIVAPEFREASNAVRRQANPLTDFVDKVLVRTRTYDDENFVCLDDFSNLYETWGSNNSTGKVHKRSNIEIENALKTFEDLRVERDPYANEFVVRGCKLHLPSARKILKDDDWTPTVSKYMTNADFIEFQQRMTEMARSKDAERLAKRHVDLLPEEDDDKAIRSGDGGDDGSGGGSKGRRSEDDDDDDEDEEDMGDVFAQYARGARAAKNQWGVKRQLAPTHDDSPAKKARTHE